MLADYNTKYIDQTNQQSPPRSPLPKRRGRNEDPVGKCAKAARVAKVKATKKAKAEEKEKQAAEAEAVKDKLAEIEIDESFAQEAEDQQRIRRLSDLASDESNTDSNDEEESADDLGAGEGSDQSETESESVQSKKCAPKVSFGLNSLQVRIHSHI